MRDIVGMPHPRWDKVKDGWSIFLEIDQLPKYQNKIF
jgi:hypothetical protein